ncbi:MAG: hypothetical protein JOY74_03695 [Sinobacteraceae bacterium]|nr:hypothetical protein [Nevskiaceae bacterium]MBV9317664.1 hypothetical protein [Gammaproteobacteria bacterium]
MLRATLLALAGALAITGAILIACRVPGPGAYALGLGGVIVLGILFERWRYRPNDPRAEAGWQPTGERFQDPHSGKTLQVYYDPRSGERRYVSESDPPSSPFGP